MKKNTIVKAIVAVVLIGGSMVFLIYQVTQSPFSYYYSVDEFSMKKDIAKNNSVRLAGKVGKGTVKRDIQQMLLEFTLTGEKNTLAVNYKGVVPNNFADDIASFAEVLSDLPDDFGDVAFPVGATLIDECGDFFISTWLQVTQRQIFQLPFNLPDAQAISQRSEYIERFSCNSLALVFWE